MGDRRPALRRRLVQHGKPDALPREKRAMGFTVQSTLRRVPMLVAPMIGGLVIAISGNVHGVRLLLCITIGLSAITMLALRRVQIPRIEGAATTMRGVWRTFP